jgi:PAS domain-containing protein
MVFHRSTLTEWVGFVRFTETDPILVSAGYIACIVMFILALARLTDNTIRELRADIARPVRALEGALQFASFQRSDAESRLAGFWDHADEAFFIAYAGRTSGVALAAANPAFWRIAGRPEILGGADWKDFTAEEMKTLEARILRCARDGGSHTFMQPFRIGPDTRQCEIRLTASSTMREGSARSVTRRVFGIIRDVTQRSRDEAALAESRSQLRQAKAVAGIMPWRWTSGAGDLEWLDTIPETPESSGTVAGMRAVHPEDRDAMLRELNHALRTGKAANFKVRIRDGSDATRFHVGTRRYRRSCRCAFRDRRSGRYHRSQECRG